MNYGECLQDLRKDLGLKQEDIAKLLNISRSTYKDYEVQNRTIPLKHLNILCSFFNVSFDYIFGLNSTTNYDLINKEINKDLFKERFTIFRKTLDITQENLAAFLNTSHSVISDYEKGKKIISTAFLFAICKEYKISADYLLGKINEPKYLK